MKRVSSVQHVLPGIKVELFKIENKTYQGRLDKKNSRKCINFKGKKLNSLEIIRQNQRSEDKF